MTKGRTQVTRSRRATTAWLVIVGLLGQFLAPLSYDSANAMPSGDIFGATLVPICTPYGVQFIPREGDAKVPLDRVGPICPFCFLGQSADGFLAPACQDIAPPAAAKSVIAFDPGDLVRGPGGQGAFRSRAPPVLH